MKRTLVAIPMKDPRHAKSRLAPALDGDERERLALALFKRTLGFFKRAFPQFDLCVVSASDAIVRATEDRCLVLQQDAAAGLNRAAASALRTACSERYERLAIVPADIPVLLREEVEQVFRLAESFDVVIAEAHDGGTNMLLLSPQRPFEFQYGPASASLHQQQAQALGLSASRCRMPFLARDLDTPADCLVLSQMRRTRQGFMQAFTQGAGR